MKNSLKNKIIFITGASSGIGRDTAYKFAKEEARLALTYFTNKEQADEVAKKCLESGAADVLMLKLDIRDNENIREVVKQIIAQFGKIDILINNAGVIEWGPLEKETFKGIENQIRVNLEGLIKMTKECLPYIEDSIINIASGAGIQAHLTLATYCATKFGVRGFTQTLVLENPQLRIFAVNPDTTATAMTDYEGRPPEEVAEVILNTAKGKYQVPNGGDINVWEILER